MLSFHLHLLKLLYIYHAIKTGVFEKYWSKENKFKEGVSSDVEGLLSLYEAAHVRIHGEDVLEEAVAITKHHLNLMLPQLESRLEEKVKRALHHSLHRGVPILETRFYISMYEREDSRDELILKLAKSNFNFLQNMYKKELYQVST